MRRRAGGAGPPAEGPFVPRWPCLSLPTLSLRPSLKPTSLYSISRSGFEVSGSVVSTKSPPLVGPGKGRATRDSGAGPGWGRAGLGVGGARGAVEAGRRRPAPPPASPLWPVLLRRESPALASLCLTRSSLGVRVPAAPRDCGTGRVPRPALRDRAGDVGTDPSHRLRRDRRGALRR